MARRTYEEIMADIKARHPDAVEVHISPSEPDCVHDFTAEDGEEPVACIKCGYSFIRYIHGLDLKF